MATPAPTRQQIDELDALLQRMLDLPVSPTDEEPEEAIATATLPTPVEAELPPRPEPVWSPPPAPVERRTESYQLPEVAAPLPPPVLQPAAKLDRPAEPAAVAPKPSPALRSSEPLRWRTLVAVNRAFDRAALRLGPVGRWLQRRRAWLGWVGLLCLAAALALLLGDGIGWTR